MTKPTDRRKFQYLPEAKNDFMIIGGSDGPAYPVDAAEPSPASEPEPEPAEPPGKYPCPCCGYLTLPVPREEALASSARCASGRTMYSTLGRTTPATRTTA